MTRPIERLASCLPETARAWLDKAVADLDLGVILPQLPRRTGRDRTGLERTSDADLDVDFAAWRTCDAAAAWVLDAKQPAAAELDDLFAHGDFEEKAMLLRSRAILPIDDVTIAWLGEAQRTNTQDHMEALTLDSNLVARAVAAGGFPLDDFNRLILKTAFVDLPLARMFGAEAHANETLSEMLQGLATEREAAGRKVWYDTCRLIGRAPAKGTIARLLGALEHGDDNHRLAAAEGLEALGRPDLTPYLEERLAREDHPRVRQSIEHAIQTTS